MSFNQKFNSLNSTLRNTIIAGGVLGFLIIGATAVVLSSPPSSSKATAATVATTTTTTTTASELSTKNKNQCKFYSDIMNDTVAGKLTTEQLLVKFDQLRNHSEGEIKNIADRLYSATNKYDHAEILREGSNLSTACHITNTLIVPSPTTTTTTTTTAPPVTSPPTTSPPVNSKSAALQLIKTVVGNEYTELSNVPLNSWPTMVDPICKAFAISDDMNLFATITAQMVVNGTISKYEGERLSYMAGATKTSGYCNM